MLSRLATYLSNTKVTQIYFLGTLIAGLIGAINYVTGFELSFSVFYLAPIVLITWYGTIKEGYLFCLLCTIIWFAIDTYSGHVYSHWFVPLWNATVRLVFFILTAYLLSSLKMTLAQEKMLARIEELTQVLNTRAFKKVSAMLLSLASRHHQPVAVGFIDLDNFKSINDNYGHSEGDRVLQSIASIIMRCVRGSDVVGRLGGDEFAVFMPEISHRGAKKAFNRMQQELLTTASKHGWPIGFSIGVAIYGVAPVDLDDAIMMADR